MTSLYDEDPSCGVTNNGGIANCAEDHVDVDVGDFDDTRPTSESQNRIINASHNDLDISMDDTDQEESSCALTCPSIEIISYGKRYGKPNLLDRNWNCTRIVNPSSSSRKGRTGLDKRLRSEVMRGEIAQSIAKEAVEYCTGQLRVGSQAEDKDGDSPMEVDVDSSRIRIGFGCEMGKHRSVSVAVTVADELRADLNCEVNLMHRDIEGRDGNKNDGAHPRRSKKKKWKK